MQPNIVKSRIEGGKRCQGSVKEKISAKPLVSIITAVYNGHKTLEETIKSVINQNFSNFEYLVIDGGSTDGTIEILKKYDASIDYWVSEPDKGIYDAFNKGIDRAKGEWLYFIGSDDVLFDTEVLNNLFRRQPGDTKLLYGNVLWGNTGKIYDEKFTKTKLYYRNICQQAIFYHRDLFTALGKFDVRYPFLADWVFNITVFSQKNANPVYVNTVIATYSIDGRSLRIEDGTFAKERGALIRQKFGVWHYINFKFFYPLSQRIRRLLKID